MVVRDVALHKYGTVQATDRASLLRGFGARRRAPLCELYPDGVQVARKETIKFNNKMSTSETAWLL